MKRKICILHDTFLYKGGGERLITMMARALDADLAAGFFDPGSLDPRELGFKGKLISVTDPIFKKGLRHIKLKLAFLFRTKFLQEYDTVLFSGDCIAAVRNVPKGTRTIYYCHTPPRYIFDQQELYLAKVKPHIRPIYAIIVWFFRLLYLRDIARIDTIYTNSEHTRARIQKYLGRDAEVIYPPVDTDVFYPMKTPQRYYLSFARLSTIKRVDRIVQAFQQMPDRQLILTYGANDPQKDQILKMIEGYPNIKAILSPSDAELVKLIQGAIATIYIPRAEDFGMSPVESMACGVPVIAVRDGGLQESILHDETGILLDPEAPIEDIIAAVYKLSVAESRILSSTCLWRAQAFSLGMFEGLIREKVRGETKATT